MFTSLLKRLRGVASAPVPADAAPPPPSAVPPEPAPPEPTPAPLRLIEDLAAESLPAERGHWADRPVRVSLYPAAREHPARPLMPGTVGFCDDGLTGWHAAPYVGPLRDVACYFARDAVVSGSGQVWLEGRLASSSELMPLYVREILKLPGGGEAGFERSRLLPVRDIDGPCVVAFGHGVHVYGHFLIEGLFRVLTAQRALRGLGLDPTFLLDADAPPWLLRILSDDLGIPRSRIEPFRPDRERLRLRRAILPTHTLIAYGFHPSANVEIAELLARLAPAAPSHPGRRVFVTRRAFLNRHAPMRVCLNEAELVEIARARCGAEPVHVEELPWRDQIATFRDAALLIGQWGSAMHSALFSAPGTRVAVVGALNPVQSHIGALRRHDNAYLSRDLELRREYTVDTARFERFLDAVMDSVPDA